MPFYFSSNKIDKRQCGFLEKETTKDNVTECKVEYFRSTFKNYINALLS